MIHSEIESFISKFKTIANAGINASLTIKTEDGKATVTLTAEVDVTPTFSSPLPHGGPARQRRRLRRAAARASAEVADEDSAARESPAVERESATKPVDESPIVDAGMATTAANSTEKVDNTNHDTVEVDPIFVASAVETIGNVVENAVKAASSQSPLYPSHTLAHDTKTTENQCQKCEFVGKTAAGLKTHMTVVHKQKSLMRSFSRVTCAK